MIKQIVLCADDYGLNSTVSQCILQLIAEHRISATSCMVNFKDWLITAKLLLAYINKVDIGLHFNLTEGEALTGQCSLSDRNNRFYDINRLILRCFTKNINKQDVIKELHAQLDQFELAFNRTPDFIDGHQHVHHLPIIRDALLDVYQQRLQKANPYVRSVQLPWRQLISKQELKVWIIQLTGARRMAKLLHQYGIPHNQSFAGFYNLNPQANYRNLFKQFLMTIDQQGLVMCHPGLHNQEDVIGEARQNEFSYFSSQQFIDDCQKQQINIRRFRDLV
ncbi:MAG: ChbG/HpnK family deacetylase [Gammaproteobacteria bacterium]